MSGKDDVNGHDEKPRSINEDTLLRNPTHTDNGIGLIENEEPNNENKPDSENIERKNYVSALDLFFLIVFSIGLYIYDVGSDVYLAYVYFKGSWWLECFLTVLSVVTPSIMIAILRFNGTRKRTEVTTKRKFGDAIVTLLQLTPLLESLEYLFYSVNAYFFNRRVSFSNRKQLNDEWYTQRVLWLLGSMAITRLIESFIEAIPQISIQLYIAITQLNDPNGPMGGEISRGVIQSVGTSLVSCSWSICFAYKALAAGSPLIEKSNVSLLGLLLMFLGYFGVISTRFFSLQFLLVTSKPWFFTICAIHWLLFLGYSLYSDRDTESLKNFSLLNFLSYVGRTFTFIFTYVYIIERRLGSRFWITQTVFLLENVVINTLCFVYLADRFQGVISGDLYSVDAIYVIVIPLMISSFGMICLQCQNVIWRELEIKETEKEKERLTICKEFVLLVGHTAQCMNIDSETSIC